MRGQTLVYVYARKHIDRGRGRGEDGERRKEAHDTVFGGHFIVRAARETASGMPWGPPLKERGFEDRVPRQRAVFFNPGEARPFPLRPNVRVDGLFFISVDDRLETKKLSP